LQKADSDARAIVFCYQIFLDVYQTLDAFGVHLTKTLWPSIYQILEVKVPIALSKQFGMLRYFDNC